MALGFYCEFQLDSLWCLYTALLCQGHGDKGSFVVLSLVPSLSGMGIVLCYPIFTFIFLFCFFSFKSQSYCLDHGGQVN